jgi:hypothetical protein
MGVRRHGEVIAFWLRSLDPSGINGPRTYERRDRERIQVRELRSGMIKLG